MDLSHISKYKIIEPEIELDGGYAYCVKCKTELKENEEICPVCHKFKIDLGWGNINNNSLLWGVI